MKFTNVWPFVILGTLFAVQVLPDSVLVAKLILMLALVDMLAFWLGRPPWTRDDNAV